MTLIDQKKIQIIHHYLEIFDKCDQISLQNCMYIFFFKCDDDVEMRNLVNKTFDESSSIM
jgi:hypothetical protein